MIDCLIIMRDGDDGHDHDDDYYFTIINKI